MVKIATELGVAYVSITASLRNFRSPIAKELTAVERSGEASGKALGNKMGGSFASSLKRAVGPALAVFGAGAIAGFAKQAVGAFSELEDSTAAAGVVFGDNMKQIIDQSKTAAKTMGLTQQQVINAANTFGTYGKAAGLSGKDLADFATEQTKLAADMASFKGTSPEQAIEAIGAALRGETEPIRAYGVMLDDASLRQEALKQGLISTTKDALTPQQKTLAAQALILKQTTDAQGDFARTSDSTANVQKTLSATMQDVSAKAGSVLAPAFTAARTAALGAVQGVGGFLDRVLAFQSGLASGALTPDLVKAIGLDPSKGFGAVVGEGIGSLRAFRAAWKANDGEVTSSGLAGYMENLAFKLRGFLDTASRVGKEVWATLGPALTQLGPPVLELIMAISPLGIVLKALGPVLPDLAASAAELAVVVAGVLTQAVQFLTPIISAVVSGLADFFRNLTSTQAGVDGLMGVLAVAAAGFVAYKVGVVASTVATKAHTIATNTAAVAQKVLNTAMKANPIGLVITAITALVAGLVWFFTQTETGKAIIETVWGAIQTFIGGVVTWFQNTVLPIIQTVFRAVGDIFTWLWKNIIEPVFKGIGWIVNAWWQVTSALFTLAIGFIRDKLGAIFTWLYENIIRPVFGFIGDLISWWWNNITLPIFNALIGFFRNTLGPVFTWLYENIIKPVWDSIGTAIKWVWDTILKPVFDKFSDIVKAIPTAFEAARDGIGNAWSALVDLAKKPVIFVVDTVIGGLIDTFNKIPGVNITKPKLPASFYGAPPANPARGGGIRAFAKGGYAAPGWALVGEEGPELVNFSKPGRVYTAKETSQALVQHDGHGGSFKQSPTGAIPTLNTGFPAAIAGVGKNHAYVEDNSPGWFVSQAANIINGLSALKLSMGRTGMPRIQTSASGAMPGNVLGYASGNNVVFNTAHAGMAPHMKKATAIHELLHVLGMGHTNAASIMNPVLGRHLLPTSYDAREMVRLYGAGKNGPFTGAVDNPFTGLVDSLMTAFKKAFPGGGMFIDAAGGLAKSGIESVVKIVTDIQNGIKDLAGDIWGNIKDFFGGRGFARGGYASPGWAMVGEQGPELVNFSRPGRVYTASQSVELSKAALSETRPTREIVIQGNVGWDPAEVARRIETAERRQRITEGVLV